MRISDWSSDVCSSDLHRSTAGRRLSLGCGAGHQGCDRQHARHDPRGPAPLRKVGHCDRLRAVFPDQETHNDLARTLLAKTAFQQVRNTVLGGRSEEHTSELQSLMRISYAVFCLKKKTTDIYITTIYNIITQ